MSSSTTTTTSTTTIPPPPPHTHTLTYIDIDPDIFDTVQIHSISDTHADYRRNLEWLTQWCHSLSSARSPRTYSILLLPGDLASNPNNFRSALQAASTHFDRVFFVCGNHDLWVSNSLHNEGVYTSIDKVNWIDKIALEEFPKKNVHTGPALIDTPKGGKIAIVPLLSWYHPSWDSEPDLPVEVLAELYEGRPSFEKRWADYRCCKWPEEIISKEDFISTTTESTALADWFAQRNNAFLSDPRLAFSSRDTHTYIHTHTHAQEKEAGGGEEQEQEEEQAYRHTYRKEIEDEEKVCVISFSHFLPRQELCPEKRFLIEPSLTKVIGSTPLRRQVESLRPSLHIFGHTHIPIDLRVEGVRYLQWPLGSVSEQSRQCAEMSRRGPVCVFDDSAGGLQPLLSTRWGEHYAHTDRDVLTTTLAPWVKSYWMAKR